MSRAVLEDCEKVEYLEDVLIGNLARYVLPETYHPATLCRRSGFGNGIQDFVDAIYLYCEDECWERGDFWGETTAIDYCYFSIALGGLGEIPLFLREPPLLYCSSIYETACHFAWDFVTGDYEDGPEPEDQCITYTMDDQYDSLGEFLGDFSTLNENIREESCQFEEPIEDGDSSGETVPKKEDDEVTE